MKHQFIHHQFQDKNMASYARERKNYYDDAKTFQRKVEQLIAAAAEIPKDINAAKDALEAMTHNMTEVMDEKLTLIMKHNNTNTVSSYPEGNWLTPASERSTTAAVLALYFRYAQLIELTLAETGARDAELYQMCLAWLKENNHDLEELTSEWEGALNDSK